MVAALLPIHAPFILNSSVDLGTLLRLGDHIELEVAPLHRRCALNSCGIVGISSRQDRFNLTNDNAASRVYFKFSPKIWARNQMFLSIDTVAFSIVENGKI